MNDKNSGPGHPDDEIDLYDLILVLKRRYRIVLGLFLVAVLASGAASFLQPPVYESSLIVRTPLIFPAETEKLIKGLNGLLEEDNYTEFSKTLGIPEEAARGMVSLKAKSPHRQDEDYVEISLEVKDTGIIHTLNQGILHYLNETPYLKERLAIKRENLEHLKKEILDKIDKIEKLSAAVVDHIEKGRIKDIGFNPIGLDKGIIALRQQLKDLDDKLELLRGYEVAVEPIVSQKPVRPRKALNVAAAAAGSLFFGVFLALFVDWWERKRQ